MSDDAKLPRSTRIGWKSLALIAAWFALVLFLNGSEYYDDLLFAMVLFVLPAALAAAILVGVPLWLIVRLGLHLLRRENTAAAWIVAILVLGAVVSWNGRSLADVAVVQFYKDRYLAQMQALRAGGSEKFLEGPFDVAFGPPDIAFWRIGGSLYHATGIAYDESDSLAETLPMRQEDRPGWWRARQIQSFACQGFARRIGVHFYYAHVSGKLCD